jgi:hypothetical protein
VTLEDLMLLADHLASVERLAVRRYGSLAPTDKHARLKHELRQAIADAPRGSSGGHVKARIVWDTPLAPRTITDAGNRLASDRHVV